MGGPPQSPLLLLFFVPDIEEMYEPQPLGMESGAITDAQITASSKYQDEYPAQRARLNTLGDGATVGGSWIAQERKFCVYLYYRLKEEGI